MRPAAPTTSLSPARRRAHGLLWGVALGTVLASVSWISAFWLVEAPEVAAALRSGDIGTHLAGDGVAFAGQRPPQWRCARLAGVGIDTWALLSGAAGGGMTKPPLVRGSREPSMTGFQEAHRQARERQRAVATNTVRLLRSAALVVVGGDAGNRPKLVTQSLRGPPARA